MIPPHLRRPPAPRFFTLAQIAAASGPPPKPEPATHRGSDDYLKRVLGLGRDRRTPSLQEVGQLTTAEAMAVLGVAKSTLIRMVRRGELRPIRHNHRVVYYRETEVRALLERRLGRQ